MLCLSQRFQLFYHIKHLRIASFLFVIRRRCFSAFHFVLICLFSQFILQLLNLLRFFTCFFLYKRDIVVCLFQFRFHFIFLRGQICLQLLNFLRKLEYLFFAFLCNDCNLLRNSFPGSRQHLVHFHLFLQF